MQMTNFFIFDCNDNIVGNPKGYRTIRGATQQSDYHGKAYKALVQAYELETTKTGNKPRLFSRIHRLEA